MLRSWTVRGIVALSLVVSGLLMFGHASLRLGQPGAMVMMGLIMVVAASIVVVPPIIAGRNEPSTTDKHAA
ncbi:MAG: hypothetical protein C4547_10820 [Phycisphaerales bacterium]|nr:MAG: hypothetical protein C4547_10820 [Phycisphaerales bacterium]